VRRGVERMVRNVRGVVGISSVESHLAVIP
jgi:hypothetical protein